MKKLFLILLLLPVLSNAQTFGCNTISMPDTLGVCGEVAVTLPATIVGSDSVTYIHWTPATGLSSTSILDPLLSATTSGWYYLTVNSINPGNLVINGDFTAGNTGFTNGYTYITTATSIPNKYGVGTNPLTYNSGWPSMGDHTTGTGKMLLIDGSTIAGTSSWTDTITVVPATNYIFSVWCAALELPLPTLQLAINGITTGTFTPTSTVGQWVKYQVNWNSGTASLANISITDLNLVWSGNDYALDDISFLQGCDAYDSIYVQIGSGAGTISGKDSVCPGQTVNLSETVSGGIWSTSDFVISDVTSFGVVKGLAPGRDTILYSVSSSCGQLYTYIPFYVRSYAACHTGVAETTKTNDDLDIYPNPVNAMLNISSAENILSVAVLNTIGQTIYRNNYDSRKVALDLSSLASGVYFIKINDNEVKKIFKE